jgi:hypothetical protein
MPPYQNYKRYMSIKQHGILLFVDSDVIQVLAFHLLGAPPYQKRDRYSHEGDPDCHPHPQGHVKSVAFAHDVSNPLGWASGQVET